MVNLRFLNYRHISISVVPVAHSYADNASLVPSEKKF